MTMSGQMRELVDVQKATETRDNIGGVTRTWSTVATVRARVRAIAKNEREIYEAMKVSARRSRVFEMWRPVEGLTFGPEHRLLWDSRTWDVMDVQDDDKRLMFTVFAVEATDPD